MWKRALKDTLPELGGNWGKRIRSIILLGLALLLVRWIGGWEQMSEELRWLISSGVALVFVLFLLFLFNLIRAPVYIRFEKEKEPKLIINGVRETNIRGAKRSWGLCIANRGTDAAVNSKGEIIYLEFATPQGSLSMGRWPVNQPLQWTQAPIGEPSISIPGSREAILEVIIYELENMWIAYSLNEDFRENQKITVNDNFIAGIALTTDGVLPIYAVVFIAKGAFGGLVTLLLLLEITENRPTEQDYRRILNEHTEEIKRRVNAIAYPKTGTDSHGC